MLLPTDDLLCSYLMYFQEYLHTVDFIVISMVTREATVPLPFRNFPVMNKHLVDVVSSDFI